MFLEIAFPNFSKKPLTYRNINKKSILGFRVKVPFGAQYKIGIVIAESSKTHLTMDIKCIESILDNTPILDKDHLHFLNQLASYYQISINELVLSAFPKEVLKENCITDPLWFEDGHQALPWHDLLTQHRQNTLQQKITSGTLKPIKPTPAPFKDESELAPLTPHQQEVLAQIKGITLLWGQTGSGKTELYIHLIHQALLKQQQVLFLVPEIALTEQVRHKLSQRLQLEPTLIHSLLTPKEKLCRWLKIKHSEARVILGTRSALLYPIQNLGLIIVDEEHDNAYRQEQGLFFSAKDAAILKASLSQIPIVLGSATPSLESYYNTKIGKYNLCILKERYLATQPKIHILNRPKHTFIAPELIPIVKKELDQNHHVMLYIGKRGYSRLLKCHHCGFELRCSGCDRLLVLHQNQETQCHHCDTKTPFIVDCPECQLAELSHFGAGSQRITEIAQELWPDYPTIRIDTDKMSSDEAATVLSELSQASATLIVGTQMLTKGHDIERLNTVIVIDADHSLYAPDFRAEEKLYAELVQVSGRSGRRDIQGHVYIQTQSPQHIIFNHLDKPIEFYTYLLAKRQDFNLPPYTHMTCLFIRGKASALQKLQSLNIPVFEHVTILGPSLFPPGQKKGLICYQIMISSTKRPLRKQAFSTIYQHLQKHLSPRVQLFSQVDSHLSL